MDIRCNLNSLLKLLGISSSGLFLPECFWHHARDTLYMYVHDTTLDDILEGLALRYLRGSECYSMIFKVLIPTLFHILASLFHNLQEVVHHLTI